ncbi:MAG: AAA family ATPase, partial [Acidobacteriota bacterium]|nr:AAA family ATPase [Acidobacteriota bacterium]
MAGTELIGRIPEVARVDALLSVPGDGLAVLEIAGAAGIGKTALWAHARRMAESRGFTVLSARPTATAAKSSFGAVADLIFPAGSELLQALPEPQREALEVALLRRSRRHHATLHRAVAAGLLGLVRELSTATPVLIAIDDWQWLDRPSRDALEFVARRLEREPVRTVYSLRTPTTSAGLGGIVTAERFARVTLAGLELSGVARLVSEHLDQTLPRPLLVRISDSTAGNPFHVLELARALVEHGSQVAPGASLPVPENLRELLLARVARLPQRSRDALALVAALAQPTTAAIDQAALAPAEEAGIVQVERNGRARHLALAAGGPDASVAAQLDDATALAERRGAPDAGAELAELAAELTPRAAAGRRAERLGRAAGMLLDTGDLARAHGLLEQALQLETSDAVRARILQIAGQLAGRQHDWFQAAGFAADALALAAGRPALLAGIECDLAFAS